MTRYEIRIDELVLRGLPEEYADTLAAQLEEQLTSLALGSTADVPTGRSLDSVRPQPLKAPVADAAELAGRVAGDIWTAASGRTSGEGKPS